MKLKKIIPLTLGVMLLASATSCSSSNISYDDFCKRYDEVFVKNRGANIYTAADVKGDITINGNKQSHSETGHAINHLPLGSHFYHFAADAESAGIEDLPLGFKDGAEFKTWITSMGDPAQIGTYTNNSVNIKGSNNNLSYTYNMTFNDTGFVSKIDAEIKGATIVSSLKFVLEISNYRVGN